MLDLAQNFTEIYTEIGSLGGNKRRDLAVLVSEALRWLPSVNYYNIAGLSPLLPVACLVVIQQDSSLISSSMV